MSKKLRFVNGEKFSDQLVLNMTNKFSWRDRFRVLIGRQMMNEVICTVSVNRDIATGKYKFSFEPASMKTWLGKPSKQPQAALPAGQPVQTAHAPADLKTLHS